MFWREVKKKKKKTSSPVLKVEFQKFDSDLEYVLHWGKSVCLIDVQQYPLIKQ